MEIMTRTQTCQVEGEIEQEDLWLSKEDFETVSEFELRPEGFCRGAVCIPIPSSHGREFVDRDRVNLSAFARFNGQPLVCDEAQSYWFLDDSVESRNRQLQSRSAPDFELPDLDGNLHKLSDYFGKKILLVSWASW